MARWFVRLLVAITAILSTSACASSTTTTSRGNGRGSPVLPTSEIFAAISSGDTAALRTLTAEDLRWVSGTSGSVIDQKRLLGAAARTSSVVSLSYKVDSIQTWQDGDVATAEYRLTDRRTFREYQPTFISRASDVYVRRGSGSEPRTWQLIRHTQTWIVRAPDTTSVDTAALRSFVGRYDRGAGYIDDVHFRNGHLVAQSTLEALLGSPGARLWPVSHSTFSPEGSAPMIVFERDAAGRVTGYVQQAPDGTIARARRLDP